MIEQYDERLQRLSNMNDSLTIEWEARVGLIVTDWSMAALVITHDFEPELDLVHTQ